LFSILKVAKSLRESGGDSNLKVAKSLREIGGVVENIIFGRFQPTLNPKKGKGIRKKILRLLIEISCCSSSSWSLELGKVHLFLSCLFRCGERENLSFMHA
jgi:hypothetical protein